MLALSASESLVLRTSSALSQNLVLPEILTSDTLVPPLCDSGFYCLLSVIQAFGASSPLSEQALRYLSGAISSAV